MDEIIRPSGTVYLTIEHKDGRREEIVMQNRVLLSGRMALAKTLTNEFGANFDFFVTGMAFGSGGTVGGVPRYVDDTREGLFGPTITTKSVISTINPDVPTQATFTSVLTFDDAVGNIINEMALKLHSGDFFSMATFGDITKTSSMQLTWNWRLNFV